MNILKKAKQASWFVCLLGLGLGLPGVSCGGNIYVATNGPGPHPYDSWETASSNIAWAVDAGTNGDTVWISNGWYVLTNQVTVASNITIRGAGGGVTVDGADLFRCFEFTEAATGKLANLTITRGRSDDNGGGVIMLYGTVEDCVFSNNYAADNGGGLYFHRLTRSGGECVVRRCTFIANRAANGGGFYYVNISNGLIDTCVFQTNIAGIAVISGQGGGLHCNYAWYDTLVTNCAFIDNVASNGAGAYFATSTSLVTHCVFSNNIAETGGGGGAELYSGYCTITDSDFVNNSSSNIGSGVYIVRGVIRNSYIARNVTLPSSLYLGGGVALAGPNSEEQALAENCTIEDNIGSIGGGVYMYRGTIRNCLIKNNVARTTTAQGGGGLFCRFGSTTVDNCTIVSNYSNYRGGGYYQYSYNANAKFANTIIYSNMAAATAYSNYYVTQSNSFTNCCFAPELAGDCVAISTNNITDNPDFADWDGGDYHLTSGSRCVNAGVYRDWMNGAVDLDGYRRMDAFGGVVDIGCYERISRGAVFRFR